MSAGLLKSTSIENSAIAHNPIKFITLGGGGAKGAAYAGVYRALKEETVTRPAIFDKVEIISGASAGAISAAMMAMAQVLSYSLPFLLKPNLINYWVNLVVLSLSFIWMQTRFIIIYVPVYMKA